MTGRHHTTAAAPIEVGPFGIVPVESRQLGANSLAHAALLAANLSHILSNLASGLHVGALSVDDVVAELERCGGDVNALRALVAGLRDDAIQRRDETQRGGAE